MTRTAAEAPAGTTPPASGTPAADTDPFAPAPSRTIADVETLKALSEPIRLRILESMVHGHQQDWTVKQIAAALGVGPTKLYHHVRILEDASLIRPSGQQLVRGIVETRYRIAQLELRLDRTLLAGAGEDVRSSAHAAMLSIFDVAREDHLKAIELGLDVDPADPAAPRLIGLSRTHVQTSRAKALEFRERMSALIKEYDTDGDDAEVTLAVFFSLHPMVDPKTLTRHGRGEAG